LVSGDKKRRAKLAALGIEYEFHGYAAAKNALPKETKKQKEAKEAEKEKVKAAKAAEAATKDEPVAEVYTLETA
jgi:hypothetical protein